MIVEGNIPNRNVANIYAGGINVHNTNRDERTAEIINIFMNKFNLTNSEIDHYFDPCLLW